MAVAPGTTFYSRLQFGLEVNARGYSANLGAGSNWPQFKTSYDINTVSSVSTLLHTFNRATVLEITAGQNWSEQRVYHVDQSTLDANDRTKVLPGFVQFFPQANPLNLIPTLSFAGTRSTRTTSRPTSRATSRSSRARTT